MKYFVSIFYIVACFLYYPSITAEAVITFFMQPYPELSREGTAQEMSANLKKVGKIASQRLHNILNKEVISGIFSTYGGFLSTSNTNGQTFFPRRHEKPFVYILITERMTPIMMAGNTIHHWELEEKSAASLYKIERKKDELTNVYYWDVEKEELPKDKIVPLESITIFAHPQDFYIPVGIAVTSNNSNLILPDVYVKKGIKIYQSTLYVLNLRHFFGPLNFLYEKRDAGYTSLINP